MIMAYFDTDTVYHYQNVFKRYRMARCQVLVIGMRHWLARSRVRRACKWNILIYWRELQGAVAQRPISA